MYQVATIEDNPSEADLLVRFLERYARENNEAIKTTWFSSALEFISAGRSFDLIFMDIDMPGIDGMEAATLLRSYDEVTPLIFVTNLAQYAVKGYEVDALDFVVKPVSYYDFSMRMKRALRVMKRNEGSTLALNTKNGIRVVPITSISYVEVMNHDLIYHIDDGETVSVRGSLKAAEQELGSDSFLRISNSCLANMGQVRIVQNSHVVMQSGEKLYFSRSRKRIALETLADYLGGSI